MSLPGSPRLDLDVRLRRAERWIAVSALALALCLPALWLSTPLAFAGGVPLALLLAAGFHRAGWLAGDRRIARMVWSSEGEWLLLDSAGRAHTAELCADTRIGPSALWLRWQSPTAATRSMLLLPGDMPRHQLRRLSVRLRIDHQLPPALPRSAAI